jgi:hypothetical protein
MPADPINPSEEFSALDGLEIVFVPVIAATTGIPTRAEIDAGTDLTSEINTWEGFEVDPQTIDLPKLRRFDGTLPGKIQITPGVLLMYADRGAEDVRTVLPDGTTGAIVFFDSGDVATEKMDIWPIQVNRMSKVRSTEAATQIRVAFTHPDLPIEDVTIPAHAGP